MCPSCSLFSTTLFCIFVLLLVVLLFKMSPKCIAKVLCSVPKGKKAAMCPTEKIHVLDKLHSGISYSTVSPKFNVNESTVYVK